MKLAKFLNEVYQKSTNEELIEKIENAYNCKLNSQAKQIFSFSERQMFFEEKFFLKLLSIDEILDASVDMNVDFKQFRIIPIIDTGDNNYIAYCVDTETWCRFNIVNEIVFDKKNSFTDLLKEEL